MRPQGASSQVPHGDDDTDMRIEMLSMHNGSDFELVPPYMSNDNVTGTSLHKRNIFSDVRERPSSVETLELRKPR